MENERLININDVAELAGVSNATVSRVLNGSESVSKKTRKKVLQAIESSGYIRNELARGLKTQKNQTIAVLMNDILNGYYAEITSFIEPLVREKGYALQLCITGSSEQSIAENIEMLLSRRVAGILVLSLKIDSEKLIRRMLGSTRVVSIEADMKGVDTIITDNEKGTYSAVESLIRAGHKRIAFLGYQFEHISLRKRLTGYEKALKDNGLEVREDYIIDEKEDIKPGYAGAIRLMSLEDPPTAIQCMNEYCAQGVYLALMEKGYRIPEDVSVSAFDGQRNMQLLYPRLTTVAIPMEAMAKAAVDTLMDNIENGEAEAKRTISFPAMLKKGNSVCSLS